MAGETHSYDAVDAHIGTTKGATSVTYVRDATGRIVERDLNGTATAKYSFGGPTDASSIVLDASGALAARTIALPGGVILTQQASGDVWSYTDVHGDVTATANSAGVKQGTTATYDPFGNALSGTAPDNSPGDMDNQWLGGPQRPTEHQPGLAPIIEMGARQYDPTTGHFLSTDPIQGGSANQYDYVWQDPVNISDVSGNQSCNLWSYFAVVYHTNYVWGAGYTCHVYHYTNVYNSSGSHCSPAFNILLGFTKLIAPYEACATTFYIDDEWDFVIGAPWGGSLVMIIDVHHAITEVCENPILSFHGFPHQGCFHWAMGNSKQSCSIQWSAMPYSVLLYGSKSCPR
jgi:RHS repeat-associated protein